jgi:hypothetical protein
MKRVFWGLVGVGLGVVVGVQVVRWANRTKEKYSPPNLARQGGRKVTGFAERIRETIEMGLQEMDQAEAEIRAELGLPPQ